MKRICIVLFAAAVGSAFVRPVSALEPATETVLYSFCSQQDCTDGKTPYASLIDVNGTLYGTTANGGASGNGTVFALSPKTGAEKVLYSFPVGNPTSSLIDVNGTLYGATYTGGDYDNGVVFALDPDTGAETVVHSFGGGADGSNPYTGLIEAKGMLYGATEYGGAHGAGTVFALDPRTGNEQVLYSFCSRVYKCADGSISYASPLAVKGTLFGTTEYGGAHKRGTVYALDVDTGAEQALYSFCSEKGCADGDTPYAGLIALKRVLYGTTPYGGRQRFGTVFALDPDTGAETALYSFCSRRNCADGTTPEGALLALDDTLYGTSWAGGTHDDGTVFALDPKTGTEKVLHAFGSGADGQNPGSALIAAGGALYGTTFAGGAGGGGTVFALGKP